MLVSIFQKGLEMSIQAGVLILTVMALRVLFRRLPKSITCLLWAIVALRLMVPASIETSWGLLPDEGIFIESIKAGSPMQEAGGHKPGNGEAAQASDSLNGEAFSASPEAAAGDAPDTPSAVLWGEAFKNVQRNVPGTAGNASGSGTQTAAVIERQSSVMTILSEIWISGAAVILLYGLAGYVRMRLRVREAVCCQDNVWQCDRIETPFLLGYLSPRIYLPFRMEKSSMRDIILHEKAHIARGDHFSKLLGFVLLAVYWFQPLSWIAYIFFCRDLEMACDERVIRTMDQEARKGYSQTLLSCSTGGGQLLQAPLAFGEVGVKARIRNILRYKKTGFFTVAAALLICLLVAVCFFTSRRTTDIPVTDIPVNAADDHTPYSFASSGRPPVAESRPVEEENYEELIAGLKADQSYALVKLGRDVGEVLLVADGTYFDQKMDAWESFDATVYAKMDGILYDLGPISGSGTAYPIRYDEDGIFVAGGHYVGRYLPNPKTRQLELVSYAGEVFDAEGNATNTVYEDGQERIVQDASYLDALNRQYSEARVVRFGSAVEKLSPQVTIDPSASITALPMETVAQADLDGDGVLDLVQVKALEPGENGNLYLSQSGLPTIQVNDRFFGADDLYSMGIYEENLDVATYYIFDLDMSDAYKEIGVYFEGPSFDPVTWLFRYQEGILSKVGCFQAVPIQETYPVYYGDPALILKNYQQILDAVRRDEILITVPGNGTVLARGRYDVLETSWAERLWELDDRDGKLREVEREEYVFVQWERENPVTLKEEIRVYESRESGAQMITLPAGEPIAFYSYEPREGWMKLVYGAESVDAAAKNKTAKDAPAGNQLTGNVNYAWLQVVDGAVVTPSGTYDPYDLFENLNLAD